jgi:methanogenic corrinoid protein MtbC1
LIDAMNDEATASSEGPGLAISDVSRVLGVPVPTLRSWELRYAVPEMARGDRSHRRYHFDQLHALRLMRDEISRGQRAADAARSVHAQLSVSGPTRQLINDFLAGSNRSEAAAMTAALDRSEQLLGLPRCLDDVLMPAMRQVGVWWQTGRCSVADEHLATEIARAWLESKGAEAQPGGHRGVVLLACGPGDLHTIGLEALNAILRQRGWSSQVLGARVPTSTLLSAATTTDAVAVVVVSHLATGRRRAIEAMQALDQAGFGVFYAGNAFSAVKSRVAVPGVYLGSSLVQAASTLEGALRR